MTGLTAPPDNHKPAGITVEADGAFFPAITTDQVRGRIRLGEGTVTDARLVDAIEGAMVSAMRGLSAWQLTRIADGATTLADVTDQTLSDRNLAVVLWERAVTFFAGADMLDMHVDVSATDEAIDRDEEKRDTADTYRSKAYNAIADLRAIGAVTDDERAASARNRVDLI